MAKKNTTTNTEEPTTTTKKEESPPPVVNPSSEIVPAAPAASVLAPVTSQNDGESLVHLIPSLPHLKDRLTKLKRPSAEMLENAILGLDPVKRENFRNLLEQLNQEKEGMHVSGKGLRLPDMRIYQGTGEDANRPETTPVGSIYGTDGTVLSVPSAFVAQWKASGVGGSVRVALLSLVEARTFWPPRNNDNFKIEGLEIKKNVPICKSLDRKRGNQFGDCSACGYRPFKDGNFNPEGCKDDIHAFFITSDFKHLYRFVITSTSLKAGGLPIKKKSQNWPKPWSYFFELSTKSESKETKRWFTLSPSVAVNDDFPQGLSPTIAEQQLMSLLCRQIDADLFYPQLAEIYDSESRKNESSDDDLVAVAANLKNLPDYSDNNNL